MLVFGGLGAEPPSVVDDDIDRLDYLLAKCFERGIYATTDLYVSRKAPWRDIGIDRDDTLNQNLYKTYVGIHDGAFADWCSAAPRIVPDNQDTAPALLPESAPAFAPGSEEARILRLLGLTENDVNLKMKGKN